MNEDLNDNYKICPFCAEKIRQKAIKCRFCNEMLTQNEKLNELKGEKEPQTVDSPLFKIGICSFHSDYFVVETNILFIFPRKRKISYNEINRIYWNKIKRSVNFVSVGMRAGVIIELVNNELIPATEFVESDDDGKNGGRFSFNELLDGRVSALKNLLELSLYKIPFERGGDF
ncbi:MAG: hypothetical protein ACD_11C00039G0003 [uncultured bacterium]|nr:MAG: hypothetical protein ACD_11C00039G0003 [uncultured bacterium]